ncbi:diaminopimelate epimerase [Clostridium sp. YIM B02515]|uniref:Diaminopimelate epimerase n=1 Tax=Clostridium rhizosphaerae TaxID=2803861 RepID=A0ABS1TF56_9CLOT|nr:diaminopimelate epimerase [Clostridium rhizosphaerae]MBL4937930.1 diaminopimelate epimerase [Clostridium rhizosphaerae]
MKFTKMHGNGNDFIVIEDLENKIKNEADLAQKLCHRNFGIGADGILLVRRSNSAQIKMTIINSDGSYAAMCGNGIRCFAKYVWDKKLVNTENISIETGDGIKTAYITAQDNEVLSVTINMGHPNFNTKMIPAIGVEEIINKQLEINDKKYIINSLLMGVPHTVIIDKLDNYNVEEGKFIEKNKLFPQGTNVNFCEVINSGEVKVKTWERGAGPTLACGTGSCASVVAANKLGYVDKKVKVWIPGGSLIVELSDDGVYMSGPAVTVFNGEI